MYWHIVFISFKEGVPEEVRQDAVAQDRALGEKCGGFETGIITWKVVENLDQRKGVHFIQISMFVSKEAYEAFRVHPEHKKFGAVLREVADWKVGDFIDS
jgi:hypothetical protein